MRSTLAAGTRQRQLPQPGAVPGLLGSRVVDGEVADGGGETADACRAETVGVGLERAEAEPVGAVDGSGAVGQVETDPDPRPHRQPAPRGLDLHTQLEFVALEATRRTPRSPTGRSSPRRLWRSCAGRPRCAPRTAAAWSAGRDRRDATVRRWRPRRCWRRSPRSLRTRPRRCRSGHGTVPAEGRPRRGRRGGRGNRRRTRRCPASAFRRSAASRFRVGRRARDEEPNGPAGRSRSHARRAPRRSRPPAPRQR